MKTPWLIQRAQTLAEPSEHRKGVDALLSFDYMGSAEFEFGSLPKSLKRVRPAISNYTVINHTVAPGKTLTVFCKCDEVADMPPLLDMLARGKVRLKEATELDVWAHPKNHSYKTRNNFWWDIDNDWMAWERNQQFAERFLAALKQTGGRE